MTATSITEAALQRRVIDYAALRGWRYVHIRPARTVDGWRTAYEGNPGLPDLILARRGVVLLAELKSATGAPTRDQLMWLDALGGHGLLWRPADWNEIMETLK